jgi:hypothetical protein
MNEVGVTEARFVSFEYGEFSMAKEKTSESKVKLELAKRKGIVIMYDISCIVISSLSVSFFCDLGPFPGVYGSGFGRV